MKRIAALFLILAAPVFAVGRVTQQLTNLGTAGINAPTVDNQTGVWLFQMDWTGDVSTGSVPIYVSQGLTALSGYQVVGVQFAPGSPAPTSGYSVKITSGIGVDLLGGSGSALSATVPSSVAISTTATPINGVLTMALTGNMVGGAKGSIQVYLQKLPNGLSRGSSSSGGAVSSVFGRTGVVIAADGDYSASQVTNTPAGGISSTTVQAAINELDTEKQPVGGYVTVTGGTPTTNNCAKFSGPTTVTDAGGTCGAGSGTVTVVAAGSLISTALVTGGGSQAIQTPSAGATLDSSGNMVVTSLASGASPPACTAGTSGVICLKEGTAPTGAASAAELYTLTDHFLYTKLNNGSQDKVCTLSAGCGASLPYTAAQQNTGPLTAVPATDVTIYSFTNVPALAAGGSSGACHTIYYIAGGNTAGSGYKIKVDGTTILDSSANQLGAGANNYEMAWFRYCNNAGVRNAQTATFIGGGYTTAGLSAASAGFIQSNFYNGLQLAPTAVDWSTSHTITLTGVAASGNLIGALMTIDY